MKTRFTSELITLSLRPADDSFCLSRLSLCILATFSALAFLFLLLRSTFVWAGTRPDQARNPQTGHAALGPVQAQGPGVSQPTVGSLRRLTDDGLTTPWTWTPDGQHVLVQRPGQAVGRQQLFELWLVDVTTGAERRLSENALDPSVHEGQLAYLRYRAAGDWQAVVADLDSGATLHAQPALWQAPPRWVDGSVLHLAPTGRWATIRGGAPSLDAPPASARVRLSPGGTHVAFTDGRALSVAGKGEGQIVARADQVYGFAWSQAGHGWPT